MDSALAASAFLMGVAGAPHCALMCSAPCAAVVGRDGLAQRAGLPAFGAGRLIGYAGAGALIAAGSAGLGTLGGAPMLRPLWSLVHIGAIALGCWLMWKARPPAWLAATPSSPLSATYRPVRWAGRLPRHTRSGLAGLGWVAIPCGLLQSALLVAALASGPVGGALVMASFAAASSLGLWFGPAIVRRFGKLLGGGHATVAVRLAGLLLATSSLVAVGHGLGDALCRIVE